MPNSPHQLKLGDLSPQTRARSTRARVSCDMGAKSCIADEKQLESAKLRLFCGAVLFAIAFLGIGFRLTDIMVLSEPNQAPIAHKAPSQSNHRAEIVDRTGAILATTLTVKSLYADSTRIIDPVETAWELATIFPGLDEADLAQKLSTNRRFTWIKRQVTPREVATVIELGLPGIGFKDERTRFYPQGNLTSHLVGFTDIDLNGLMGLEKSLDEELRSNPEPTRLTIDLRLQHILHARLERAMEEFQGIGAAGLIMDVNNGEILSMVSLPDFDPNHPGKAPDIARFNRASMGIYELGSVFKIFNTAMALDSGAADLYDQFDATHPITIGGFKIHDYKPKNRWLSVPEIMKYSSNIGSAQLAMTAGANTQQQYLRRLGLMDKTAIELPEKGAPLYPHKWRDVNTMTVAFGHGIAVSPVHLATAASSVVNGGWQVVPHLTSLPPSSQPQQRLLSARTSLQMRRLLRLVVAEGTAKYANAPGMIVGGKTGTAEKLENGRYSEDAKITSFIGVFPMHNPRYAVFAMVDEPKGHEGTYGYATGGWVAAPVVGDVIKAIAPILNVPAVDEHDPVISQAISLPETSSKLAPHKPPVALTPISLPAGAGFHQSGKGRELIASFPVR